MQLSLVKNNVQEAIKSYNTIMSGINFIRDPVQQEFFDDFSKWYDQKCKQLLENKFEVIKLLIGHEK